MYAELSDDVAKRFTVNPIGITSVTTRLSPGPPTHSNA